jgi:predicted hydrolase (HD superfamily)
MEAGLKKKHLRILARGHIKNDEEFYIVAEILSDMEFEISEYDRAKLEQISYAYEARPK